MVKLAVLPDHGTIRALRGSVDFYTWKGLNIARSWPRKPKLPLSPSAIRAQAWLQLANGHYRASSNRVKGDFRWLQAATTWTARDSFMGYYFGTIPFPCGLPHANDPNPPPYPIPDPNHHYATVLATQLYYPFSREPLFAILTTGPGDWWMRVPQNLCTPEWGSRSRYGHVYPTTPIWTAPGGWVDYKMTHIGGNVYVYNLKGFEDPVKYVRLWFFFYIRGTPPALDSRGHSPLLSLALPPTGHHNPWSWAFPGGLLRTDAIGYQRPHEWGTYGYFHHRLLTSAALTHPSPVPPGSPHDPP